MLFQSFCNTTIYNPCASHRAIAYRPVGALQKNTGIIDKYLIRNNELLGE
jgi:hypothetical protein